MVITSNEKWNGRQLGKNYTTGRWGATRVWDVVGATNENDAMTAEPLPGTAKIAGPMESHPQSNLLQVVNHNPVQTGPLNWLITATYDILQPLSAGDAALLKVPTKISVNRGHYSIPVDRDARFGIELRNSAGDAFSGNFERPFPETHIRFIRYEPYWDIQRLDPFIHTVNTMNLQIGRITVNPEQLYCGMIGPAEEYVETAPAIPIAYDFVLRKTFDTTLDAPLALPKPFQLFIKDAGRNGWYDDAGTKKPGRICFPKGLPVDIDVALDGTGKPINKELKIVDENEIPHDPVSAPNNLFNTLVINRDLSPQINSNPIWLEFYATGLKDFSLLRL
jgi:hypothetical protein